MPGVEEREPCGPGCGLGDRSRICTADFTWSPFGACESSRLCEPGTTRWCQPCGTQACNSCGRWEECVDGPDDTANKDFGDVWETDFPRTVDGWVNDPYGADWVRIRYLDNHWVAMAPYDSITFQAGEGYELIVFQSNDGWSSYTETRATEYCTQGASCTLTISLQTPDRAVDGIDQPLNVSILVHRVTDGPGLCDTYHLVTDA